MILKRKNRRIFFYSLACLFFILAPIILGYSFGYRFDFVNGAFEQTGGIFIKSKTPRLSIFLDGTFKVDTSLLSGGALIPEVAPGAHLLRVEKAGFRPWSKTVSVGPSFVTEIRSLLLVPDPLSAATSTKAEAAVLAAPEPAPPYRVDGNLNLVRKTNPTKAIAKNVYAFRALENKIYFVDKNGFLATADPATNAIETIGRPGFFLESGRFQFVRAPQGETAIIDAAGGLYFIAPNRQISVVATGVKKISFDSAGDKALLLHGAEIDLLWMQDNKYQPFQKKGTLEKIIQTDTILLDAQWFLGDDNHIVFQTKDGVYFTEIDGRGGRNTTELVVEKTDEIKTSLEVPYVIYYRAGKTWKKIEI